jgi:hypothetical protein
MTNPDPIDRLGAIKAADASLPLGTGARESVTRSSARNIPSWAAGRVVTVVPATRTERWMGAAPSSQRQVLNDGGAHLTMW